MSTLTIPRAWWRVRPLVFALPVVLACLGESPSSPGMPDRSVLYWDLNLNHHAVTLSTAAPYDTLRLVAMPRNIHGDPIEGLPMPQFVSADLKYVAVTPDGVLIALAPMAPGTSIKVTATLTVNNLKHTDYALVQVLNNPTPPVLTDFSARPVPPDSSKLAARRDGGEGGLSYRLPLRATDETGAPMTDLLVSFRSSDTRIADINELTGAVEPWLTDSVTFYAAATAFGIAKADTVPFRIGLPITSRFVLAARSDGSGTIFNERALTVGVGAVVVWQATGPNMTTDLDIEFTDPTHVAAFPSVPLYGYPMTALYRSLCDLIGIATPSDCTGSGNFVLPRIFRATLRPPRWAVGVAVRGFPVPGIYDFHSTLQGVSGRVIVVDESEP